MDPDLARSEFEKCAKRLGIEVRYTAGGPSGLCTVKGDRILFIDRNLDTRSKIDVFVHAFKSLDLSDIYMVPGIRRLLGLDEAGDTW